MKNLIITALTGLSLLACADKKTKPESNLPQSTKDKTETKKETKNLFSVKEIINSYLSIKNALTKDDGKAAAEASKKLFETLETINADTLDKEKKSIFIDIYESMRENAEHISTNAGNVEHQREHFALLSRDINDLTDNFGTAGLKLYLDFCPMYNKQNGAIWVSEKKEIVNPYYGSKMSDCGSVKKAL
ncbi:DUF3347 domain-containing protein [Elizabethkingia anophelis]|uniref:DUF3347 domain-containing protein n=2 Tax=Elizabethkingia anophelis TaxID=1117645 RepID=A0ABN5BM45_9FLAO|nr:DUF3347 domain-containing protein [Elizabethkingia anophelis]AIL45578.1 putative Co/Zn/Cd efflux system membrane fusion protein [Elizabethkingia anophelis NUHP1]AKH94134.1 hypothetical protein M876_06095 [Elizabethkingia anophelis FMS-007]ATC34728.1 DUF3347 domain-containing protein [Elizabethkingia anophelis R26]ATC38369.1 DUF3347 domain-containing protein [Elizabethkingia anophelis Ag1]ATC42050.1 DUF3347 domain-containing protein [Elizabethkingia anophelis]